MDFPNFWKTLWIAQTSPINVFPLPEGAQTKNDFLKNNPFLIASFWISRSWNIFPSKSTRRIRLSLINLKISLFVEPSIFSFSSLSEKSARVIIYHLLVWICPFFHNFWKCLWISRYLYTFNDSYISNF